MGGSNVYLWAGALPAVQPSSGTARAAGGPRQAQHLRRPGDGAAVCGCVASNAAHLVESGGALANLKTLLEPQNDDEGQPQKTAAEALVKLRCDLGEAGADEDMIEALGPRTFPTSAAASLFPPHLTLPNFVPKTTIEFNAISAPRSARPSS